MRTEVAAGVLMPPSNPGTKGKTTMTLLSKVNRDQYYNATKIVSQSKKAYLNFSLALWALIILSVKARPMPL